MSRRRIQRDDVARFELDNLGGFGRTQIAEVTYSGITFREKGHRFAIAIPWRLVLAQAERLSGEAVRNERLRKAEARRRA